MKRYIFLFLIYVLYLQTSCSEEKRRIIEVCYYDSGIEFSASIEPIEFSESFKNVPINEIRLPALVFDSIYTGFHSTSFKKNWEPECRFCVRVGKQTLYLSRWFDAFSENYDSVAVNPHIIYLLREYSGYYNRIELEDLKWEPGVKRFGVPQDYHYRQPSFEEFGRRRVVFLRGK